MFSYPVPDFIFLIIYQLILANYVIEGLTPGYKPYDLNNPNIQEDYDKDFQNMEMDI